MDVVHGEVDHRPVPGHVDQPAVRVGQPSPTEVLHHVALQCGPADIAAVVTGLHGQPVIEVGVHQRAAVAPDREHADGLDGRVGHLPDVLAAGHLEGEVLAEVADRGDPGRQRRTGVHGAGRSPDHEVAEMRLDGGRLTEDRPLLGLQRRAGLLVQRAAVRLGHTHRPGQGQAEAVAYHLVLGQPGLDLLQSCRGRRPVGRPDMRVVGDPALATGPLLDLALRTRPVAPQVGRLVDRFGCGPSSGLECAS